MEAYWALSFADWTVNPKPNTNFSVELIQIFLISPVIRLQTGKCFLSSQPYLEIGLEASLLSNNNLGHRKLGGQFAFQDLLGIGLHWGTTHVRSLS